MKAKPTWATPPSRCHECGADFDAGDAYYDLRFEDGPNKGQKVRLHASCAEARLQKDVVH